METPMGITVSDLELWQKWARQDNAFDLFVPSDIRQMIGEIFHLRGEKAELVGEIFSLRNQLSTLRESTK
jgi:hypothetical protein